jgi:hypothetical protein
MSRVDAGLDPGLVPRPRVRPQRPRDRRHPRHAPATPTKISKDTWQLPARAGQPWRSTTRSTPTSSASGPPTTTRPTPSSTPRRSSCIPDRVPGPFHGRPRPPRRLDRRQPRRRPRRPGAPTPPAASASPSPTSTPSSTPRSRPASSTSATSRTPARTSASPCGASPCRLSVLPRLATGRRRQVEAHLASRPYAHYTFIVHAAVGAGGGLEHLHGSVLGVDPETLRPRRLRRAPASPPDERDSGVLDFLELAAHELFHAWNGKRLRPIALGPFDYHRENYTRELWLVEGLTSYYDRLIVLRSGEMPVAHLPQADSPPTSPASPPSPAASSTRSPTPASTPGSSCTARRTTAPTPRSATTSRAAWSASSSTSGCAASDPTATASTP